MDRLSHPVKESSFGSRDPEKSWPLHWPDLSIRGYREQARASAMRRVFLCKANFDTDEGVSNNVWRSGLLGEVRWDRVKAGNRL